MSTAPGKEAFDRFLTALDPDRAAAGHEYERLRARLIQVFAWERCRNPERWADEVLDRVARRIGGGEEVRDVAAYTSGVARLVLREARRAEQKEDALEPDVAAAVEPDDYTRERTARALDECLKELPPRSRELIVRYYQGDSQARIRNRQLLADEERISLNSLRNRALRLREKLEACVRARLDQDTSRVTDTRNRRPAE